MLELARLCKHTASTPWIAFLTVKRPFAPVEDRTIVMQPPDAARLPIARHQKIRAFLADIVGPELPLPP